MSEHYIEVCSCGEIISQCRCTRQNKTKRVIPLGCKKCKGAQPVNHMAIYRAELEAGLAEAIRSTASVSYASLLKAWEPQAKEVITASVKEKFPEGASASLEDLDLHFLQTILASTGWNDNDDVFDPIEVWVARHTPAHKPFNYEHDCADIIGHIVSSWVMTDDGLVIAEDTAIDDLPEKFHVATGGVLYTHWAKPELQERMDQLLAEIGKGDTWYVSMECLFRGFDYALKGSDGVSRVVARNEKTAFLTKHLRAYGGTGSYEQYRVGRLMRNIVFSGKGLVKNPANKDSVILPSTSVFSAAKSIFSTELKNEVYASVTNKPENENKMSVELQNQLAELKAENEKLKASLVEGDAKRLKDEIESLKAEKVKAEGLVKEANDALAKAKAEIETLTKAKAEADALLKDAQSEIRTLHQNQRTSDRVAKVKAQLRLSDEEAKAYVSDLDALTDDAFARQVERSVKLAQPAPEKNKDEKTAAAANLDAAKPDKEVDLTTKSENAIAKVQKDILSYFSRDEGDNK